MRSLKSLAAALTNPTGSPRRDACCGEAVPPAEPAPPTEAEGEPPEETGALIRFIVERYHAAHRRDVPDLIRLAGRVEAAHGGHPEAPLGLADLLSRVLSEMEQHLRKEEDGLFPMILEGHPDLLPAIDILVDEHDDHGKRLRQIRAMTRDHTPPEDACATWRALYAGTRKFADDLEAHIDLEDNVLFRRFSR